MTGCIGVVLAILMAGSVSAEPLVGFDYDYDRNALIDSRIVGDTLIALTRAGHLLRFSLPGLGLDRERISGEPFTSLGSSGGGVSWVAATARCSGSTLAISL